MTLEHLRKTKTKMEIAKATFHSVELYNYCKLCLPNKALIRSTGASIENTMMHGLVLFQENFVSISTNTTAIRIDLGGKQKYWLAEVMV